MDLRGVAASKLPRAQRAQLQVMLSQSQDIVDAVARDGSSGVHAPAFTLGKVKEAKLLAEGAQRVLLGKEKLATR